MPVKERCGIGVELRLHLDHTVFSAERVKECNQGLSQLTVIDCPSPRRAPSPALAACLLLRLHRRFKQLQSFRPRFPSGLSCRNFQNESESSDRG